MSKKLALAMKEWLFDRYAGFNNDDSHSWKFSDLLKEYEKENGILPIEGWRSKKEFNHEADSRVWKEWEKEFPESVPEEYSFPARPAGSCQLYGGKECSTRPCDCDA